MSSLAFQRTSPYTLGTTVRECGVAWAEISSLHFTVVQTLGTHPWHLGRRCRSYGAVCTCRAISKFIPGLRVFLFAVIVRDTGCQKWSAGQGTACELLFSSPRAELVQIRQPAWQLL